MHRLLIVDDNPGDRELCAALLAEGGGRYEVIEARSLRDARAMLEADLDAIVLDVRLPDGTGADLIPEVHATQGTIAILVLSGSADEREAIEAVRAGAYDYLKKDELEPRLLARTLRAALEQASAQRELATERAALARSEARFRAFAQSIPEPSWAADTHGRPRLVNDEWTRRFGPMRPWTELVEAHARPEATRAWLDALERRAPLQLRVPLRCDRGVRHYLVRAQPAQPPISDWYATLTDVEDLEAARAQLERISQGKDNFMAILGHELRNPLGALYLMVDDIERDPSDLGDALPMVRRQLEAIERITAELYDASRFITGRETLHIEPTDLSTLVQDAVTNTRPRLDERGVTVHLEVEPQVTVRGDPVRLTQVVTNLLVNAAKYGREGGSVWVRLESRPSVARLEVCDDGPGIDPDLMPVLFEPFTRADRDRTRPQGGLGLGLSVAHRLVELHGGTISAGDREGGGAVMSVQLPRRGSADQ